MRMIGAVEIAVALLVLVLVAITDD